MHATRRLLKDNRAPLASRTLHCATLCVLHASSTCRFRSENSLTHLSEAPVGLAGQAGDAPAGNHTLSPAAPGDGNGVQHLVLVEDAVHCYLLLKQLGREVHLVSHLATVDLQARGAGGQRHLTQEMFWWWGCASLACSISREGAGRRHTDNTPGLAVHRAQQPPRQVTGAAQTSLLLPGRPTRSRHRAAPHLNLHEVRLPLAQLDLFDLCVSKHTDDAGMLAELIQGLLDLRLTLILLSVLGEGPLFRLGPAVGREWGLCSVEGSRLLSFCCRYMAQPRRPPSPQQHCRPARGREPHDSSQGAWTPRAAASSLLHPTTYSLQARVRRPSPSAKPVTLPQGTSSYSAVLADGADRALTSSCRSAA